MTRTDVGNAWKGEGMRHTEQPWGWTARFMSLVATGIQREACRGCRMTCMSSTSRRYGSCAMCVEHARTRMHLPASQRSCRRLCLRTSLQSPRITCVNTCAGLLGAAANLTASALRPGRAQYGRRGTRTRNTCAMFQLRMQAHAHPACLC